MDGDTGRREGGDVMGLGAAVLAREGVREGGV
jgi:hypothetical protein